MISEWIDISVPLHTGMVHWPDNPPVMIERTTFIEEIGRTIVDIGNDLYALTSFVGEMAAALANAACHPGRVRWNDTLLIAEAVGIRALPIVALIGFLMGLIMAFQAAIAGKIGGSSSMEATDPAW